MRLRKFILLITFLALLLGAPMSAYADPVDVVVSVDIEPTFVLVVHPGTSMDWEVTNIPDPLSGLLDYDAPTQFPPHPIGWTQIGMVQTCRVWANANWTVAIKGLNDPFGGGDGNKPVGDIVWIDGDGSYSALTTNFVAVKMGTPGNYTPNVQNQWNFPVTFRILLDWGDDPPGLYTNTVQFTIGASS